MTRIEAVRLTRIGTIARRPQGFHYLDVLRAAARARFEVHLQVVEFFFQPADADAKVHASTRQIIEVRHCLGRVSTDISPPSSE